MNAFARGTLGHGCWLSYCLCDINTSWMRVGDNGTSSTTISCSDSYNGRVYWCDCSSCITCAVEDDTSTRRYLLLLFASPLVITLVELVLQLWWVLLLLLRLMPLVLPAMIIVDSIDDPAIPCCNISDG